MAATFIRARSDEQAREILDSAYSIANNITSDDREWVHVFDKAVDLLSAGTMIVEQPQQVPMPLDLNALKGRH